VQAASKPAKRRKGLTIVTNHLIVTVQVKKATMRSPLALAENINIPTSNAASAAKEGVTAVLGNTEASATCKNFTVPTTRGN
jgi:hypothetical protein